MKRLIYKLKPFVWGALSAKQRFIFTWWRSDKWKDKDCIIAEGSIRSGKTVAMALSFIDWATETYDRENFIMAGKTIQSFRRNVADELKKMCLGRGYVFDDNQSKNVLTITNKRTGNTCFFFMFGGKDEGSSSLVQGITAAGAFFDEVALMPKTFVNQATARCSVEGSKFWFNCNPEGPMHWFKKDWIDRIGTRNGIVIHFDLDDNLTLSEKIKDRYRKMYQGVFYQRYILGLWVVAEGIIYDMFSIKKHVKKCPFSMVQADRLFVSIDYGIQNPMTYGLYGVKRLGPDNYHYHLFKSYYHSGRETGKEKTDEEYFNDLEQWLGSYKDKIRFIIVDPSASSFITLLRKQRASNGKQKYKVIPARNDVMDGIALMMSLLAQGRFTLDPQNTHDIDEFHAYMWDAKAIDRGEEQPVKQHDHCMDRNRYAVLTDRIMHTHFTPRSGKGAIL